jgi:hypothetical protein
MRVILTYRGSRTSSGRLGVAMRRGAIHVLGGDRHFVRAGAAAGSALLVLSLSIGACSGGDGRPAVTPTGGASTSPSPTGSATRVTEGDDGRTLEIPVGRRLRVELGRDYLPLRVSGDAVVTLVRATGGFPTGRPLVALLAAVRPGTATLRSSTDFPCRHDSPPCALPQQEWRLSVNVLAGPS